MSKEKFNIPKTDVEIALENGEKLLAYSHTEWYLRRLTGQILTIIDASISELKQNKAIKDLIKNEIRENLLEMQTYCFQGRKGHSPVLALPELS